MDGLAFVHSDGVVNFAASSGIRRATAISPCRCFMTHGGHADPAQFRAADRPVEITATTKGF